MIDSHMHVNSVVLDNVNKEISTINSNSYIEAVINVGLDYKTSKEVILISRDNGKFYAAVGVHPLYVEEQNMTFLYDLAQCDKVVVIGEIGLDSLSDNLELQKKYLIEQIMIANEVCLPVIIHSNNMNKNIIEIFEKYVKPKYGCVFHCFQPNLDDLDYLVTNGYYISFAGKITYKTAKKSIEVIKNVPNSLFLVETDSPYIAPEPYRNQINHVSNISYIVDKIVEIKGINYDELESLVSKNTKRLFRKIK